MNAESIRIDTDEDGFYIEIDGDSIDPEYQAGCYRWRISDPQALYDHVKAAIGPWLRERDDARVHPTDRAIALEEEARELYALGDPDHHSVRADLLADQT